MNVLPVVLQLPAGRARLEPLDLSHAADLLEAGADPAVWRYNPYTPPKTVDEMKSVIASILKTRDTGAEQPFAIVDRTAGRACGSTRYMDIDPKNRSLEIGFTWIGVPWQRSSINTECKRLLLGHAFETLGCVRVQLKCDARNVQSQRAIERIGGVFEGRLRKNRILHDGYIRDSMYYSIIADEWPATRAKLDALLSR